MLKHLLDINSLTRNSDTPPYQIHRLVRDILEQFFWEIILDEINSLGDRDHRFLHIVKGQFPRENKVHYHAEAPDVHGFIVPLAGEDLRRRISQRAHFLVEFVLLADGAAHAEVDDLHLQFVIQHHIFRLQIAVHDPHAVQVTYPFRNLDHDSPRDFLFEFLPRN